jgi:phosphoglycerate dehydrogenase-like enzyme
LAVEPIPDDPPLLDVDTVVLTPHLAGITEEAMRRMSTQAAANVRTVYEGRVPRSTLNRDELDNATLSRDTE